MVGGIIVTHGRLAIELVSAAEIIVGQIQHIIAVSIGWNDEVDQGFHEIERAIKKVNQGQGVLILTDMFGGTPTNVAMTFSRPGNRNYHRCKFTNDYKASKSTKR